MVGQHVPTIHDDDRVPDTEAVEAPLHDIDVDIEEDRLEPEAIEERLHSIHGDIREHLMVEHHTPMILEDHDGVLEGERVEKPLRDSDDNALESGMVKERLFPIQDDSDAPKSPVAGRQSPAEHDDNSISEPEAIESRLHIFDDNASESNITEQPSQVEQGSISQGDVVETAPHASTDSALACATVERRDSELPIEVCEWIIGFLDDWDVQTIANCALVCRRLVYFSRFKLYHCIPIHYRWQWTAFERLILLPASSDMAVYLGKVQQLRICPRDKKFFDKKPLRIWPRDPPFIDEVDEEEEQPRIGWRKGQERPWAHLVLVECAARLPAVTCIELQDMDWSEHYYAPGLRSSRDWLSLTTLVLYKCTFKNVAQLHLFVTAFPALKDLSLQWIELKSKKTSLHISKGGHPLTRLVLWGYEDDHMAEVTRWLAGAPNLVTTLADLDWWPHSADHWKRVTDAIDGASLQNLELRGVPSDFPGDLSRFTHLRVLKLRYSNWSLHSYLESVNNIIFNISSDQLEELDIELWHLSSDICSLETILTAFMQFKAIGDLLSGPRFTHLCRVKLEYQHLEIYTQAIPDISPSSSRGNIMPVFDSSSQLDSSNQLISALPANAPDVDLHDPQHPFRLYAEPLLRRKIRGEMKQLDARGILDIKVTVHPWHYEDTITVMLWGRGEE